MNKALAMTVGIALLVLLLLFSMTFTVAYHEVAIKSTFGRSDANDVITEPGLEFKLPIFADRVVKYDTRLQMVDSPEEELQLADGQTIVVRGFLLWRVDRANARQFANSYATIDEAEPALTQQFQDAMAAIGRFRFDDLIGNESKLREAENAVLAKLEPLKQRGIDPVSVGFSQVKFPPKTSTAVLSRMEATNKGVASNIRTQGMAEANYIESAARTKADTILAFAERRAEEIKARGKEQAVEYMEQMSEDEDLAIFLVWLDALRAGLQSHSTFVMPTDRAPFHLLDLDAPVAESGIPIPRGVAGEELRANLEADRSPEPADAGTGRDAAADIESEDERDVESDDAVAAANEVNGHG